MKDTVITAARKRTELWTAGICFLLAVLVNAGAILYYHTPFYELFTQIGFTVVIAVVFYVVWTLVRILVWAVRKALKKNRDHE